MRSSKLEEVLEPLFAFSATDRPFAEVSRLAMVSRNWRTSALKALKTAPQLNLSGCAESVRDEDVRLVLVRVTSENLKRVDLSFCHNISACGMEDTLQYIAEKCSGVKEVDLTGCSNDAVLRAVAIRARAVCGVQSALDLYTHLKSLEVHAEEVEEEQDEEEQEDWRRYPFSYLSRILHASTPLLLFDPELAARKNALFQAAAHGTGSDVAMLLSLSFAVGDADDSYEDESDEDESDEDDIRTYDVNEEDSQGNSPLLLTCRSGNLEIAEILVVAGAGVSCANYRGDTPLLAAVGAGNFELAEMLVKAKADVNVINGDGASALHLVIASDSARSSEMVETLLKAGADVNVVRRDGASVLALAIVSGNARILNCRMMPTMIEYAESAEISYVRRLSLAFLEPNNIFRWFKDGRSARELLGTVCALMTSAATERPMKDRLSHVRAFINCHIDLLQDPTPLAPLTVTDVVKQLALQESDSVFDAAPQWTASIERGVVWANKPPGQHACRWTKQAGGNVHSLVYSPDGSRLARAEGNHVVVCDAVSGFEVHRLKGHSSVFYSVAFSADGTVIASGSLNRTVFLWDAVTGSCKCTLNGHSGCVFGVCFSPDGSKLASCSGDRSVMIWNIITRECVSTLTGHTNLVLSVAWSPDGTMLASGSADNTAKLWNAGTFECQSIQNGHTRSVTKLEYVDAKTLISGSEDSTMRVWSVDTGAQKEELDGGSFAFSKDSSLDHKVGKYSITFKDDLLLISEGQSVVAFFRAPHDISTIGTAGERIGVGCNNGEVLQLRAHWLV